jgi:hypothetical protein
MPLAKFHGVNAGIVTLCHEAGSRVHVAVVVLPDLCHNVAGLVVADCAASW